MHSVAMHIMHTSKEMLEKGYISLDDVWELSPKELLDLIVDYCERTNI